MRCLATTESSDGEAQKGDDRMGKNKKRTDDTRGIHSRRTSSGTSTSPNLSRRSLGDHSDSFHPSSANAPPTRNGTEGLLYLKSENSLLVGLSSRVSSKSEAAAADAANVRPSKRLMTRACIQDEEATAWRVDANITHSPKK